MKKQKLYGLNWATLPSKKKEWGRKQKKSKENRLVFFIKAADADKNNVCVRSLRMMEGLHVLKGAQEGGALLGITLLAQPGKTLA